MKNFFSALLAFVSFGACSPNASQKGYTNIDNKIFHERMQDSNVVILDVRTPEEYYAGHIPNATLMNLRDKDFPEHVSSLDKSKTYLVYCAGGSRSSKASAMLIADGITTVYNLEKGFNKWNGQVVK